MSEIGSVHHKTATRFSSPGEIFFTMCYHWVWLTLCLLAGGAIVAVKVLTDGVVYEGKASLLLNYGDSIVVEQGGRETRGRDERGRDEAQRFFNSRVEILQSDPVLRAVVKELKPRLPPAEDLVEESSSTPGTNFLFGFVKAVSAVLEAPGPPSPADHRQRSEEDWEIETALLHLQKHSRVVPNPLSS